MSDMPAREQLTRLAEKLAKLESTFTPDERAILLAVFGMASAGFNAAVVRAQSSHPTVRVQDHVATPATMSLQAPPATSLPSLGAGFESAFVAGKAGSFALGGLSPLADSIGVSVGGICVSVSWSKDLAEFTPIREVIDIAAADAPGAAGE